MDNRSNITDEMIQKIMDTKTSSVQKEGLKIIHEDAELYDIIMKNLDLEPTVNIPLNFAEKTSIKAFKRKKMHDFSRKLILILAVSIPLISMSLLVIQLMNKELFTAFFDLVLNMKDYILFAVFGIWIIQVLDKILIQNKFKKLTKF